MPVRGGIATNDHMTSVALAAEGQGLAYALEPAVAPPRAPWFRGTVSGGART
ncbi:hypothetical protein [Hyalangium rubrum]|uniref:Uncharacterized protein n=1 Tax=Hyalangium rubrum TaxID=3103134 RepID=A0ABU5H0S8_9BACT|nr:hypothetical protein [Hyalangium sp. s54d21]MDY7227057.1 hypothetical protein [Hyalangium sp. s54d21]